MNQPPTLNRTAHRTSMRRGASLVEMIVVMGVASVTLTIGVTTIHLLLGTERSTASAARTSTVVSRCSQMFRADVHSASDAEFTEADENTSQKITLTFADQRVVRYQVNDHTLIRTVMEDGEESARESFHFPSGSSIQLGHSAETDMVSVTIRRQAQLDHPSNRPSPEDLGSRRRIRIAARLSRDLRWSQ